MLLRVHFLNINGFFFKILFGWWFQNQEQPMFQKKEPPCSKRDSHLCYKNGTHTYVTKMEFASKIAVNISGARSPFDLNGMIHDRNSGVKEKNTKQ